MILSISLKSQSCLPSSGFLLRYLIEIKLDFLWFRLKFTFTCLRRVEIVEIIHRTVKLIFVYSFAQVGGIHGVIGEGLFMRRIEVNTHRVSVFSRLSSRACRVG